MNLLQELIILNNIFSEIIQGKHRFSQIEK